MTYNYIGGVFFLKDPQKKERIADDRVCSIKDEKQREEKEKKK